MEKNRFEPDRNSRFGTGLNLNRIVKKTNQNCSNLSPGIYTCRKGCDLNFGGALNQKTTRCNC
ncbi:hypothetical protein HanIR_Chr01g0036631 [Helianthus annuus]|nr:hypothetical protein HanIR_Chr01g0036631 [Helianthus annuus]